MNAKNFEKWGAKKLTSNFPPQPVIVLDNSPYHCLRVDRPLSTCVVKTGMMWLGRKCLMRHWAKMTYQLLLPQKPKEISTKLIAYLLIMVMQFSCLHTWDLNLMSSHEPKLKRLMHHNITVGVHLRKLLQVTNELVWLVTKDDQQGYWKHVENIQKEYLERDRVVPYVIDNIIVHMNPEGDSCGDGDCESSNTKDRSDCS